MHVAVCFNRVPEQLLRGTAADRISEEGAEHEARAVAEALKGLGHTPHLVGLADDVPAFLEAIRACGAELVFNLCEGFWGDSHLEMHVAAVLELLGLPLTGSPALCLGMSQNKSLTKTLLTQHGLPTPKSVTLRPDQPLPRYWRLTWPLIVKPASEDASLGIGSDNVVDNERALAKQVRAIHDRYQQPALVEEFVAGREFNVSVLGHQKPKVLPLAEIQFAPGLTRPMVTYAGKWHEDSAEFTGTQVVCPAHVSIRDDFLLRDVALRAFKLLGCRDYARVDIRLKDGVPYILEVNANPDISPDAGLARSARIGGLSYPQLIDRIVKLALKRKESRHAA